MSTDIQSSGAATSGDPLIGRVLDGRFTLQAILGRGGMGVVYRAHQASLERAVALKVMVVDDIAGGSISLVSEDDPRERAKADFQRRFFLEAATVARLKHHNTITVFDYGSAEVDGKKLLYIAMELIDGTTLSRLVPKGRALDPLRAVNIGIQICRALREAHKLGVIHRDLKPGNVMVVRQEDHDDGDLDMVKVLDFGLAKTRVFDGAVPVFGMTRAGTFMGSPRYVAPEQVEGRHVDARTDIYAFGCLMYRMLSGHVPFDGESTLDIIKKHVNTPTPLLVCASAPTVLIDLVMQCLKKAPDERPTSMQVCIERLKLARDAMGGQSAGFQAYSSGAFAAQGRVNDASRDVPLPASLPAVLSVSPATPDRGSAELRILPRPKSPSQPVPASPRARVHEPSNSVVTRDDTRPTGLVTRLKEPAQRPALALAAGVMLGLLLCLMFLAWRTGLFSPAPRKDEPLPDTALSAAVSVPLAKQVKIRIHTTPDGANVLEDHNGLPRLLGVTPLTLNWTPGTNATRRTFTLKKDGHVPAKATVEPPRARDGASAEDVVVLDVEATLRPQSGTATP